MQFDFGSLVVPAHRPSEDMLKESIEFHPNQGLFMCLQASPQTLPKNPDQEPARHFVPA